MKLRILTPARTVLEGDVVSATLPGAAGQLTPMHGHDFLVTPLAAGKLYAIRTDAEGKPERQGYVIAAGLAEVVKDAVTVFTSKATIATEP